MSTDSVREGVCNREMQQLYYQDDGAFLLDGTQQLESTQFPLACLGGENRSDSDITMHQITILV